MLLLLDIMEEHRDEASFLYTQRLHALESLTLTREHLGELDDRLLAHLDGLLLGGEDGWALASEDLAGEDEERVFIASYLALASETGDRLPLLLAAAEASPPAGFRGILNAFRWSASPHVEALAHRLLKVESIPLRLLAVEALAFRRIDPGAPLGAALRGTDPGLRATAAWAAGVLRRTDLGADIARTAQEPAAIAADERGAGALLEAWALQAPDAARAGARSRVNAGGPEAAAALRFLGLLGNPDDAGALAWAAGAGDRELRRAAILAAAVLGSPRAVSWLRGALDDPAAASLAGWALRRMFGAEALPGRKTKARPGPRAGDREGGASQEDEEMDGAGASGQAPPTPLADVGEWDPPGFDAWWAEQGGRFQAEKRYRLGDAWHAGPPQADSALWSRHEEAFEEALANPGAPRRETRALGPRWSHGGGFRARTHE